MYKCINVISPSDSANQSAMRSVMGTAGCARISIEIYTFSEKNPSRILIQHLYIIQCLLINIKEFRLKF